ncbi:MAG: hypothetical protein CSA81_10605 [Acidobacteria bacterium]|nr:MAG: hypothetical protein CSA81_10605 [Acidobacteriota bacterium]
MEKIRTFIEVTAQPTVIKLDAVKSRADWITESFLLTQDAQGHIDAIHKALSRSTGLGMFLIGHYGSGKSHFLAFLHQQLSKKKMKPKIFPISLLNYSSETRLETLIERELNLQHEKDRRESWARLTARYPDGVLLLLDELSEFLRSKPTPSAFHEDIRFLQFLGEWSQDHPLWILAALQEQIEHTGNMSYELYRKIKDRYPLRFFLSPTHVQDIIAAKIIKKKDSYDSAIEQLIHELKRAFPKTDLQEEVLAAIYPLHPMTMTLLEEVRALFSEARGMIDFTVHQLRGSAERGISPFLDEAWGNLLSPDYIVSHFRDLLEMQGDFQKYSRQLFPRVKKVLPVIFKKPALYKLAEKLISCLVLVHLSPNRTHLTLDEAVWWLLVKVTTIVPEKNRAIIEKVLNTLVEDSGLVTRSEKGYALNFGENELESLERWLAQAERELKAAPHAIFNQLFESFPPDSGFPLPEMKGLWRQHHFMWHFHKRVFHATVGVPRKKPEDGIPSLVVFLPWEKIDAQDRAITQSYRFVPRPMELTRELRECAALASLKNRPMSASLRQRYVDRMKNRISMFHNMMQFSYQQGRLYAPDTADCGAVLNSISQSKRASYLDKLGESLFHNRFPRFHEFAPCSGRLSKDAIRLLMRFFMEKGIEHPPESTLLKMIFEAYLIPMKLIQRRGIQMKIPANIEKHELVDRLMPMLDYNPPVKQIYKYFQEPLYGLVPDQISLLLIFLLTIGEIDIFKGKQSYRDHFETLTNPINYDRVTKVQVLNLDQIKMLQTICEGLNVPVPKRSGDLLYQKKTIGKLKHIARDQDALFTDLLIQLQNLEGVESLTARVQKHLNKWRALEKGSDPMQQIQHFLFEIASPVSFLQEQAELALLPQRLQTFIRKKSQLSHTLQHPMVQHCPQESIRARFSALQDVPGFNDLNTLEQWMRQVEEAYGQYQHWYRQAHHAFWGDLSSHTPLGESDRAEMDLLCNLAVLPQIGLHSLVAKFREEARQYRAKVCRELSDLNFSPLCHCGFNGETAPAAEHLAQAKRCLREIRAEVTRFFKNSEVREKVTQWRDSGADPTGDVSSYLAEIRDFPEIVERQLFAEHLEGVFVVQDIPLSLLKQFVRDKVWQSREFVQELQTLTGTLGGRFRFIDRAPAKEDDVIIDHLNFTLKAVLSSALPLTENTKSLFAQFMGELTFPADKCVSSKTMKTFHKMNLNREIENWILERVKSEHLKIPHRIHSASPLNLIQAWRNAAHSQAQTAETDWVQLAYSWHDRMYKLFGNKWMDFINTVPAWIWGERELTNILKGQLDADWLIVDCLGLPLVPMAKGVIEKVFSHKSVEQEGLARVTEETTTDGFFKELLSSDLNKSWHKIDDLDQLLHTSTSSFAEMERMAALKLELRLERYLEKNNPAKLLIFSDHGFRLHQDGRNWVHSGGSNLERTVPYWLLS